MSTELVVITVLISLIIFFVSLAFTMQNVILKSFYSIVSMLVLIITLNTATVIATDNGSSAGLITLLSTSYQLGLWISFIVSVFIILGTISHFVVVNRERKKEEDDE